MKNTLLILVVLLTGCEHSPKPVAQSKTLVNVRDHAPDSSPKFTEAERDKWARQAEQQEALREAREARREKLYKAMRTRIVSSSEYTQALEYGDGLSGLNCFAYRGGVYNAHEANINDMNCNLTRASLFNSAIKVQNMLRNKSQENQAPEPDGLP